MLDRQKTWETVLAHLLSQNAQADQQIRHPITGHTAWIPAFRAPNGRMSPLGVLLGDRYHPCMEQWSDYQVLEVLVEPGYRAEVDRAFLADLQSIHDEDTPPEWAALLWDFGERWGLCLEDAP